MIDSPRDRDPLELLADEFAARLRRGESPSVADYVARYPQHAGQIEDLFGAVAMLEQFIIHCLSQDNVTFQRMGNVAKNLS